METSTEEYNFSSNDLLNEYENTTPLSYSRIAEWFVLILWVLMCLEGLLNRYIEPVVKERSAFWARLTPWLLMPSDVLFYGLIFWILLLVVLLGRRSGYRTSRGIGLLIALLVFGAFGAIHGKIAGAEGNLWLEDLRQICLRAIFVPLFCILATSIRLEKMAKVFCRICVILAIYNGIMGILKLLQLIEPYRYGHSFSGEVVLILAFSFILVRFMLTGKGSKFIMVVLAFGIVLPLRKTSLGSFVIALFLCPFISWWFGKRQGFIIYLRSIKLMVVLGVMVTIMMYFALTIGGGEGKRYLAQRWLKTHVGTASRDITSGRLAAYQWGLEQWTQHPFLGTGFGFRKTIVTEHEVRTIIVHSLPITILFETGLIGFLIFYTVFVIWFRRIYRFFRTAPDVIALWPLVAMFSWVMTVLIACLFGRMIAYGPIGFMFWICIGFLTNVEAQHHAELSDTHEYDINIDSNELGFYYEY